MSSIMEQSPSELTNRPTHPEKRTFFLRSSSIQKIKCSATYPFRIAGSKLSREAIKQLIESLIIKARLFSQKALLILYITTLKVLGTVSPISTLTITDDVCDKVKETERKLTFVERLFARMIKLHAHKLQHQQRTPEKKNEEQAKVTKDYRIDTTPSVEPVVARKLLPATKATPKKSNLMLIAVVYASAILIYVQLLALAIALNMAPTPPGLIFMVASLSLIGYLAFKVLSQDNRRILKRAKAPRKNSTETSAETNNKDSTEENRQSRFPVRRTFDLGGKTLSKIKML